MGAYRIQRGDTLSGLASRYGTSVGALMRANPQVKDANLIYAGALLNVPGRNDDFEPAARPRPRKVSGPDAMVRPASASSRRAFELAKAHLGRNAGELKLAHDAVGRAMQDWVPNDINCANFVSGVLEAAGLIPAREGSAGVYALMNNLDADRNFRKVSLAQAQPGDVVSFRTPSGGQHVEFFAGWRDGRPLFLGSNNVNPDGSQRVSYSQTLYSIMAIHHYAG